MMKIVTVSPSLEIEIPASIRNSMGIRPGDLLHAIQYRGRIELLPVVPMNAARGMLKGLDTLVPRGPDRA